MCPGARHFILCFNSTGLKVLKLEFILGLKIKHNDWLLAEAANHCALF